jgi:hypothetical protein
MVKMASTVLLSGMNPHCGSSPITGTCTCDVMRLESTEQNNFAITASKVIPRQLFGLPLRSPDFGGSLSFPAATSSELSSAFSHLQIC